MPQPPGPPTPAPGNPYATDPNQPAFDGPYTTTPYGPPADGAGGSGGNRKRKAIVIGTAVTVLLAAGGAVFAVLRSDDGGKKPSAAPSTAPAGPHRTHPTTETTGGPDGDSKGRDDEESDPDDVRRPGEAKVLYQTPAPELTERGVDVPGFWVRKGHVVKAVDDEVTAYKDDGSEKWSLSLPKAVCAAPDAATDGKVVVAYAGHRKRSCGRLALIDLDKGVKLWDREAPESGPFGGDHSNMGMAQSGDLVGLSWFGGSAMVRVDSGKEVSPGKLSPACSVDGYAGGKVLLRAYSCNDGSAELQQLTPDGKIEWTYAVRKGFKVSKIFSTSPAVVALSNEDRKSGGVLAISERGAKRSSLALGKQSYQPRCRMDLFGTDMGACQGVAATADTLYLPTELTQGGGSGPTTEIHAFDLDSGKKKWALKVSGRMLLPLSTDGRNLIAYEEPTSSGGGLVVSVGPGGGTPRKLLQLPRATRETEAALVTATRIYRNGTFYIASDRITGTPGAHEKLLMAFGP
ncbi:PQQ-binding-like beta-propeller repeat protein [Streptomyces sp. NA02950]|uniref:outer membrane protein assembly factor BamB family protein n=1 Tax=Streptomyces sp. NA02950 TaxID=2742137 RepID=UPI0020CB576D|nr:PQQ-binding-like beta-propeller repeat protein [Streptomyces sp. NA02950]